MKIGLQNKFYKHFQPDRVVCLKETDDTKVDKSHSGSRRARAVCTSAVEDQIRVLLSSFASQEFDLKIVEEEFFNYV